MKIGLILAGNIWYSPYLTIYTKILDNLNNVEYDIISWNRDGSDKKSEYQYNRIPQKGLINKFMSYHSYARYVKSVLKKNKYDRLIVFGSHISIMLSSFLIKKYSKRYILDYRDLSIEQNFFLKPIFERILKHSCLNIISSLGYKKVLPQGYDYIISHNFDVEKVRKTITEDIMPQNEYKKINVLTIGGLRNFDTNLEVVKALANKNDFLISFVGKGESGDLIREYATRMKYENVSFVGYYPKEKETDYVSESTFMNIYFPNVISHSTIMSNRLYLALIHKKPMIVTANSTQADYINEYDLGLAIENCESLDFKIKNYLENLDYKDFSVRCNNLLKDFLKDYDLFESCIIDFCSNNYGKKSK